jgi:hypothetical protein
MAPAGEAGPSRLRPVAPPARCGAVSFGRAGSAPRGARGTRDLGPGPGPWRAAAAAPAAPSPASAHRGRGASDPVPAPRSPPSGDRLVHAGAAVCLVHREPELLFRELPRAAASSRTRSAGAARTRPPA